MSSFHGVPYKKWTAITYIDSTFKSPVTLNFSGEPILFLITSICTEEKLFQSVRNFNYSGFLLFFRVRLSTTSSYFSER